jgi:hypothetical protein
MQLPLVPHLSLWPLLDRLPHRVGQDLVGRAAAKLYRPLQTKRHLRRERRHHTARPRQLRLPGPSGRRVGREKVVSVRPRLCRLVCRRLCGRVPAAAAVAVQQRGALASPRHPGARFTNFQELFLTRILNAILNRLRIDS